MTFEAYADWRTRHALNIAPDESSVYWPNVTRRIDWWERERMGERG